LSQPQRVTISGKGFQPSLIFGGKNWQGMLFPGTGDLTERLSKQNSLGQ
jgi:hypothetical protein